jgi:RHS repeat-associated protein
MRTKAQARGTHIRLVVVTLWIASTFATTTASAQTSEVVTYYHADAIGSIRMITDANGQVVERHDYLPFGEEWQPPASQSERRLFAGQERDHETALDYFGARFYGSGNGRFINVDPEHVGARIFDPQRWNGYSYARNNPLRFFDLLGLEPCPEVTNTSTCVEGTAGSGQLTLDYITAIYVGLIRNVISQVRENPLVLVGPPVLAPLRSEAVFGRLLESVAVTNPIPRTLARVIPGRIVPTTLARPGTSDVFVTAADDIAGLDAAQIAVRLGIPPSASFTVIEFETPSVGIASPVFRSNPGFRGGGLTSGGAREFVIPNGPIPPGATVKTVR